MHSLTPSTHAAALCSASRVAARYSPVIAGSLVPLSPLVATTYVTSQPSAQHLAIVPPQRNSASSGCATITIARRGRCSSTPVCSSAMLPPAASDYDQTILEPVLEATMASLHAFLTNLRGPMHLPTKIRLLIRNVSYKVVHREDCCG